jgi:catalase
MAVHAGRTPYLPNTVGGGCPFLASDAEGGYIHVPRQVDGPKTRERSPDDEYTQAIMFWRSMTEIEQDHIVDAYTFELGKVDVPAVVELMVERLAHIDGELAARVAIGLGLPAPDEDVDDELVVESPSLAMVTEDEFPVDGRVVHILATDGCDLAGVATLKEALLAAGAAPHVIATHKGAISDDAGNELTVDRSFHTASSAEADAVIVAGSTRLAGDPIAQTYIQSAYRHYKPVGAWGDGVDVLVDSGVDPTAPGVVTATGAGELAPGVVAALAVHRHWDRAATHPTRLLIEV